MTGIESQGASYRVSVHQSSRSALALILFLALLLPAPASMSQSEGIVPRVEDGKRIYTVEQFARFAPQTAADLVGEIPGFSVTSVS